MKNAAIYIRVSTEKQVKEGYSILAQKENLEKFAKNNRFNIYKIYADKGISGKNIDNRPALKKLIEDIKKKYIDIVLIQKLDRLTRNVLDTDEFIKLFEKYNIDIWTISEGKVDISNSNGKFMTLLKGLFAQHEREITIERIKVALDEKAKQGYTLCCGCCPYGYERIKGNKIIQVKINEAKIVQQIYKMYLENYTLTEIANELNMEGIPTKKFDRGKKYLGVWTSKTIKGILLNPVYIGKVRHNVNSKDIFIGKGYHQEIINKNTWYKVQEKMAKNFAHIHTNKPKEDAYFCGILICGLCGSKFTSSRTIKQNKNTGQKKCYTSYRCMNKEWNNCKSKSISHKKIEELFVDYLGNKVECLDKLKSIDDISTKKRATLENKKLKLTMKKRKNKLLNIISMYSSNLITYEEFNALKEKINESITILDRQIKQNKEIIKTNNCIESIPLNLSKHWEYLTNKEKGFFINEFVENIIIVNKNEEKVKILKVNFFK